MNAKTLSKKKGQLSQKSGQQSQIMGQKDNKLDGKILWCLQQKQGIGLVEPNDNLSEQYFREAKETLQEISGHGTKWDVIMAYYACYNALYALLMKAGIKCEIHDCTINVMKFIDGFDAADYMFLTKLKDQRIQAQYYLKKEKLENLPEAKKFVMKCQVLSEELKVDILRGKLNVTKK